MQVFGAWQYGKTAHPWHMGGVVCVVEFGLVNLEIRIPGFVPGFSSLSCICCNVLTLTAHPDCCENRSLVSDPAQYH